MAGLVAPEAVVKFGDVDISAFTGAGRVDVDVRAASPETEAAIQDLTDTQNQLFEQWQVLRDLGNPDVTLEELQNEIASRKSEALDNYRDVDTAAAISLVKNQESVTALGLAREHYQIELSRLEGVLERQGDLQDGLVALTGERDDLVVANAEQLRVLEEAIARTEKELDDGSAVKEEIAKLEQQAKAYRDRIAPLKAQADNYSAQAKNFLQQYHQHLQTAHNYRGTRNKCGRWTGDIVKYSYYQGLANQAKQKANRASEQAAVALRNYHEDEQLALQLEQQAEALRNYAKAQASNAQNLSQLEDGSQNISKLIELLKQKAAQQTQIAEKYWQQTAAAEKRRLHYQLTANWHNSMINRWEVIGYRHTGFSGWAGFFRWNRTPIHGWRKYPEHIAPRNQAKQQARNAEAERRTFEQWARQAQTEANALNQQATALAQRLGDWPQLKRGIEYEINAKEQQLQAEKDLLALPTPVQQQQLEALDLKINQTKDELQKLETEELPEQQQKADATEERLQKTQEEVEENQTQRSQTQTDLQNFLETYGYLLPYQERRAAVQKQIQQLTEEITIVQQLLLQLQTEVANNPNNNLTSQLESTKNYLEQIEQQLAYAKVQEEQLNLSAPDSPERLAIGNLIDDLAKRQQNLPETNTLPLQEYIDFLRGVENRNNNLLNGFDDLEERLTAAQTQQTAADETLQRLQGEYRDLGLEKADIEAEKLMPSQIQALQADIDPHQEILDGYRQQISDAHAVASNFERLRQKHQGYANRWNSKIRVFNTTSYLAHNPDVARSVRQRYGGMPSAWYHYWRYGRREGRLANPGALVKRNAAQAVANNYAKQRNVATVQAQHLEASLQPNIYATQATIAAIESKQQIFKDIQKNIQPNATLEEAIALKDSQLNNTKTAISQTQDTINSLENDLAATKQAKSDKEAEIVGQEGAITQTQTEIATTEDKITAKQGEINQEQSVLQGYHNQINQANAVTNNFEQQRQYHQNSANYWNGQIHTWGVTGYRQDKSGNKEAVYGWIYNPQAKANRDAHLVAANSTTQQRNLAAQQAQQLATNLQPQIEAKQENIAGLQEEKQTIAAEKQNLQTQLSNQQQELQNLQSELGQIEQNIGNIESDIATNEEKLEELDAQLLKESSDKIYLQDTLAEIDQRIADKEAEISDKYEEIELTEKYARHVNAEVDRLESRLELINQADALETEYQNQQDNWQNALDNQIAATEEFLATRKAGEDERKQLLSLQSQLADTQTQLATAQQQQAQLITEVQTAKKDLQLTQLQLRNQHLQLQSLNAQDPSLYSAEAYYYNQAQHHRARMWYSNGRQYVYHHGHAAAYRANLQKASRLAQQRNENWSKRQEAHKKIQELNQAIATQRANVASKEQELAKVTPEVANLTAKAAEIESQIPPLVTAIEPLQQAENEKLADFQNAVGQTETASVELAQTTKEQAAALNHLISFGVLGTESDVDFFATQVEPKVNEFIQQLQDRSQDLGSQADTLGSLIADWQQELDNTTDEVSRQALTDLITETIGQQKNLLQRQQENQEIVTELSDRLTAATASLENLREQQELEIREQLNSNDERLEALNRQLETETAAEKAVNEDTVLAYAQLNDQVRADLTASATQWVSQLQEGHQQTQEIGESQQNLSQSVDDLIQYIDHNLAEVDGERDRNLEDLRDAITTLGVVAPRRDELAAGETSLKQEIEKLKQWIEQDAKLWEEIAPIAERYGAEYQQLARYPQQYNAKLQHDLGIARQNEAQRLQHQQNANYWNGQIYQFNEQIYLQNYPDVRLHVSRGWLDSGWEHYVKWGRKAGRLPNPQAKINRDREQAAANAAEKRRDAANQLPTANAYREAFLSQVPNNGSAIKVLQAETKEESNKYSSRIAQLKAEEAQNNAQASAALAQADWYERRGAYHWQRSRKNGPTWQEWRKTWKRGRSGKKKEHWVLLTHVDHDWIIWDTYTKYAQQLRQQAVNQLVATDRQSQQQDRLQPLAEQWADAQNATNAAEAPITASRNLVEVLETAREQMPAAQEQLQLLEDLLPEIEQKLAEAQKEADDYNAKVLAEWEEHDENATEYINTVEDILERRGELNKQSQELQNQLADTEKWVEQQTVALDVETEQVDNLRQQLIGDGEALAEKIAVGTGNDLTELQTKQAQLQDALALLDNKATVLQQQQAAFSQKRTLLTAENEVILAEQRLLDAYLTTPDSDLEQLREQLADARAALAEAQRLAEQAEASSQALTAPLQEVQNDLLAQNDEHLKAAKEHQEVLKELLEATELNANYTLEAAKKQQQVNDLEFQILQRLQDVTAAGNEEAKHLLEVATHNDIASAAQIYYRDYSDLASDKRSSSAGGLAKPEDRILADRYYREMLTHRQLQHRAQAQANHFRRIKDTAQGQMDALSRQQETAAQILQDINNKIAETQELREAKEQEVAVAQARLDGISRIRQQTEQTFVQLVSLEQLNLAQAQLEQQIAAQRQSEIEEEVARRIEREQIEIERQRLEARAKLEQLEQLQAEEDLRQAVNQVRVDVGLNEVAGGSDSAQLQSQMASLLGQLQNLEQQQPDLPDDVKALLADAQGDLQDALEGKVQEVAKDNLSSVLGTLILQGNSHRAEINKIIEEERRDATLLEQAQDDLHGATKAFVEELDEAKLLQGERQILTPLAMESLLKVAHAKNAVNISKELAAASYEIIKEILDYRKEERKARKKAFWASLVNIAQIVLSVIGIIFPPAKPFTTIINVAIGAIWAAVNGDWLGAIFNVVTGVASFASGMLGEFIKKAGACVCVLGTSIAKTTLEAIKRTIDGFKALANGAYKGILAIKSGDDIAGVLTILQGLAEAVTTGINGSQFKAEFLKLPEGKQLLTVVDALKTAPTAILGAVRAIENGDLFSGINTILAQALSLGQNLTSGVANSLFGVLGQVNQAAGVVVDKFINKGGFFGWLEGIGQIGGIFSSLPQTLKPAVDDLKDCKCPTKLAGIVGKVFDAAKLEKFAHKTGAFANAVENTAFSTLAISTVIEGATKDLKSFFKSLDNAKDYLKEGFGNDIKRMKADENSAYNKLKKQFDAIADQLEEAGEDVISLDLGSAYRRLKKVVESAFSSQTLKPLENTLKEFLHTFEPLVFEFDHVNLKYP